MNVSFRFVLVVVIGLLLSACEDKPATENKADSGKENIVTLNNPLYYFTRRLAGDLANVTLPVTAGVDPAQWTPEVDDILKMQKASLIILNGADYSNWIDKVSLNSSQLVNSSLAVRQQWIALDGETTHSHGPEGEHSHSGFAFTIWMDISLAQHQVKSITNALARLMPKEQQVLEQRETELLDELTVLDEEYQQQSGGLRERFMVYSHPVYQYFERRYQLNGHSLHWEPDQMPTEEEWTKLEQLLIGKPKPLFVWEDEPAVGIAERMQSTGIEFVVIRPAANVGEQDWLSEQKANIQRLQKITSNP